MSLVEPARLERHRVHERGRRQLLRGTAPTSLNSGSPFQRSALISGARASLSSLGADLVRERRIVVDVVVVAVGERATARSCRRRAP